ncbi:MAG: T9SS type A sorting domain-containing protein [Candidatus Cloacimonetes bacterium]|nr:T9SS type A sorting domain-containing protein [Candidatus Cloacimonadota bacterium]
MIFSVTKHKRTILLALFCLLLSGLFAHKIKMVPAHNQRQIKQHPYAGLLRQSSHELSQIKSRANNEKLLVILVDFQEEIEDDPNTTGNGRFQLTPDPDYLISIAAAPHDREYFEYNLEAMRYYYLAVSAGNYNLDYDVWPKDKTAYTLPHKMGYYHPPNVSSAQFISLMEEYFRDSFQTADKDDPQIDFSQYAHYMIIHAGSDWQHDVFSNTPSDLPSFFIRVSEDKKVAVNNGAHYIYHACNVPETISQDFETEEYGGLTIHSGYGALNGVMFHEFGHSLGLVDLYNTYNSRPMVGVFDIMDSGGSAALHLEIDNGDFVQISGVLPSLPGAFSRALIFEDEFRAQGLMRDISEYDPGLEIELVASSFKQGVNKAPTIIKYPLGANDYFLFENRNIDPDRDGGVSLKGALDQRVALYPTVTGDDHDLPTYEYDFTLPSFEKRDGYEGGGMMVWYVNEDILYHEGQYLEDGELWSNFQNNTVNTNFDRLGVMVLEADGYRDLGNPYSMYWTGTQYEYFHGRKPQFDDNGVFLRWSNEGWTPILNAFTKPALIGHDGIGGVLGLEEISDPDKVMTFKIKGEAFDGMQFVRLPNVPNTAPVIESNISRASLSFYGEDGLHLVSIFDEDWMDLMGGYDIGDLALEFDYPLINAALNQSSRECHYGVRDNILFQIDYSALDPQVMSWSFAEKLGEPILHAGKLYLFDSTGLRSFDGSRSDELLALEGIVDIVAFAEYLLIQKESELLLYNALNFELVKSVALPGVFTSYSPVLAHGDEEYIAFLVSDNGDIYNYDGVTLNKIFTNHSRLMPTQLAVYQDKNEELQIFFGLDDKAYLMKANGFINGGYPLHLGHYRAEGLSYPKAIKIAGDNVLYLKLKDSGYLAILAQGKISKQYSLNLVDGIASNDYVHYDSLNSRLYWHYSLSDPRGCGAYIHQLNCESDPILFAGKLRGKGNAIRYIASPENPPTDDPLNCFVYPNPVKTNHFRIKVLNAKRDSEIKVFDISGKLVYSDRREFDSNYEVEMDSHSLSSGVYLLQVKSGKSVKHYKFAVEK